MNTYLENFTQECNTCNDAITNNDTNNSSQNNNQGNNQENNNNSSQDNDQDNTNQDTPSQEGNPEGSPRDASSDDVSSQDDITEDNSRQPKGSPEGSSSNSDSSSDDESSPDDLDNASKSTTSSSTTDKSNSAEADDNNHNDNSSQIDQSNDNPEEYIDRTTLPTFNTTNIAQYVRVRAQYGRVEKLEHYNDLHNDHISDTNFLGHAILKASISIKQQDHNKAIVHYDAIRCKFRQIGIHNVIDYNQQRKNHNILGQDYSVKQ